jgi:tetratricopeptide (TPR) repeat protein
MLVPRWRGGWTIAVCVALLFAGAQLRAEPAKPAYEAILAASDAAAQDPVAQKRALEAIDAEIAKDRALALNHYVRGRILSRLGREAEALKAYEEALRSDPKLANAHYNAGAVLARMGRLAEAAKRFDRALEMEELADAAYNAGQAYYDLKDFKSALARFQRAYALAPGDFDSCKKIMQAQMALGLESDAWSTRDQLLRIWKTTKDPAVRRLKEYVLDQFDVGTLHVMAYETFAPAEDLAYIYTFRAFGSGNTVVGTVQLETSAVIREGGVPYLIGISGPQGHQQAGIAYKKLPKYSEVKQAAQKLIAERFKP